MKFLPPFILSAYPFAAVAQGVIFLIDAKTVEEAHAAIDATPLPKENLVDHEYIPVGPLMPLTALIAR
jgi:hypothetical protein